MFEIVPQLSCSFHLGFDICEKQVSQYSSWQMYKTHEIP